jgi:hypothetical protein
MSSWVVALTESCATESAQVELDKGNGAESVCQSFHQEGNGGGDSVSAAEGESSGCVELLSNFRFYLLTGPKQLQLECHDPATSA